MSQSKKTASIIVQDVPVTIMKIDQRDYISLTDMAKARTDAGAVYTRVPWNMGDHVQSAF